MPKGSHLAELNAKRRYYLEGKKFGKLTVVKEDGRFHNTITYECKCECGNFRKKCQGIQLLNGKINSCGCSFPVGYYKPGISKEEYEEHVRKQLILRRKIINDCWEYQGQYVKWGYGYKTFGQGSEKKKTTVHRIAYYLWKGEIAKELCVLHSCDNPKCFNPDHLWLGTISDNSQDMLKKGRGVDNRGEKCGMAKLKEEDVTKIREMRKCGHTFQGIADMYDVSNVTIYDICLRKTWRHI